MGSPTALAIGLVLAIAVFGVIANHAREMYKDKKYREMAGALFWATAPIAIFCLFWIVNEHPTDMARNITLGFVGAVLGAAALIWGGYVAKDISANAQSSREVLVGALNDLATAVANAPPISIGVQGVAVGQPGQTGVNIGVMGVASGSSGTNIGVQGTASSSSTPVNASRAESIRELARQVQQGGITRTQVQTVLAQTQIPFGPPEMQTAQERVTKALEASDLPN
jgi:hypothetical protein